MVCVHLDCPVADALEPIRAHASAEGVSAHIVAERILRGELRLGQAGKTPGRGQGRLRTRFAADDPGSESMRGRREAS